ncbi:MAG TPA: hypothetical protein VG795_15075 [Acidimicrobiia bacterium]|nr:hypothetical protein [Acidimicrobiia bacterium]
MTGRSGPTAKKFDAGKKPDVTLKIPRKLYDHIANLIDTDPRGFRSPTEFILFILRDLTGTDTQEMEQVRSRLRSLGYLDKEE